MSLGNQPVYKYILLRVDGPSSRYTGDDGVDEKKYVLV